jgi:hypothetical protein
MTATEPTSADLDRTREHWLRAAWGVLGKMIHDATGAEIPPIQVSVGYGGKKYERDVLAVCNPRSWAEDGVNQIFISPEISDPVEFLRALLHEGIHAVVDCQDKHGGRFKEIAIKVGFGLPMTSTPASAGLKDELELLAIELGPFPHAALHPQTVSAGKGDGPGTGDTSSAGPSDTNRNLGFRCVDKTCPGHTSVIRMVRSKAERCAMVCLEIRDGNLCSQPLEIQPPRTRKGKKSAETDE